MEKHKQQEDAAGGDWMKAYPHGFWAFSRSPLSQSLMQLETPELEEVAVQMFLLILTYAGISRNSGKFKQYSQSC